MCEEPSLKLSVERKRERDAACDWAKTYGTQERRRSGSVGIRLFFAATKTVLKSIQIEHLKRQHSQPPGEPLAASVTITWEPGTLGANDVPTAFAIEFDGEPPFLIDSEWLYAVSLTELAVDSRNTWEQLYEWRQEEVDRIGCSLMTEPLNLHPAKSGYVDRLRWWCSFDAATTPELRSDDFGAKVQQLRPRLTRRLEDRGAALLRGRSFDDPGSGQLAKDTELVSEVVCEQLGNLPLDKLSFAERVDDYFESFVCGDLALSANPPLKYPQLETHGAPNGTAYFLLAEAALLFGNHGCAKRRTIWQDCLRTFVRTCEIFLELYWNGACRKRDSYGFMWRGGNRFQDEKRRRLRDSYAPLTQEELESRFAAICAFAFRDQILLK